MIYASADQVAAELEGHTGLGLPAGDAFDRLIAAAERAVDRRLGGYPVDPIVGLKLDPTLLTAAQRDALVRAVAVAVGHLAQLEDEDLYGTDDFTPAALFRVRGVGLRAKIDEQLAGSGLVARSSCALPDPPTPNVLLGGPYPGGWW